MVEGHRMEEDHTSRKWQSIITGCMFSEWGEEGVIITIRRAPCAVPILHCCPAGSLGPYQYRDTYKKFCLCSVKTKEVYQGDLQKETVRASWPSDPKPQANLVLLVAKFLVWVTVIGNFG